MPTHQFEFSVVTDGRGTYEITPQIEAFVIEAGISQGICHVFVQHTSASLMVCENADPDVRRDLETFMRTLAPDGDPMFIHRSEGADDMPAHVRSILTGIETTIPVRHGRLALGTWQGVYLWEHRFRSHHRRILVTVYGD